LFGNLVPFNIRYTKVFQAVIRFFLESSINDLTNKHTEMSK